MRKRTPSDNDRSSPQFTGARYPSQSADESIDAVASMSDDGNNRCTKWDARKCKSKCQSQLKSEFDGSGRNRSNYPSTGNDVSNANSNANQPNATRSGSDQPYDGHLWHSVPASRCAGNGSAAFDVGNDEARDLLRANG